MNFDELAKDWDVNPKMIERAEVLAGELKNYFKFDADNSTAFEFGSGTGLLSYQLKNSFKSITLADSSEGMLDVVKTKIKFENITNLHPILIDMPKYDLSIPKVDHIFTFMALHHVLDINKLFKNFNAILNDNGYISIGDLVSEDGSFHSHDASFDGHNGFDKEELTAMLANNGFIVEHYKIFYQIEKEHLGVMKTYPLFLIIAKKK